jgi:hypothetical protein
VKEELTPSRGWQDLLASYEKKYGKPLPPVKYRTGYSRVPERTRCPSCQHTLFTWKQRKEMTIYKCCNDACPLRLRNMNKFNEREKALAQKRSSQFKLSYQYREYYYQPHELAIPEPEQPAVNLRTIYNGPHILDLVLTFYVSFAFSARKTALVLRSVFSISISYQTVLNYAAAATFYCHCFNLSLRDRLMK